MISCLRVLCKNFTQRTQSELSHMISRRIVLCIIIIIIIIIIWRYLNSFSYFLS